MKCDMCEFFKNKKCVGSMGECEFFEGNERGESLGGRLRGKFEGWDWLFKSIIILNFIGTVYLCFVV